MIFFVTDMPQPDVNMFDCLTIEKEQYIPPKDLPVLDYLINGYNRAESGNTAPFVYSLFETREFAFAENQDAIIGLANEMFSGSSVLDKFEQDVLSITFKKSIKSTPTLPGRK